jgi:hypothetical protein
MLMSFWIDSEDATGDSLKRLTWFTWFWTASSKLRSVKLLVAIFVEIHSKKEDEHAGSGK